jgi:hypothetical protein
MRFQVLTAASMKFKVFWNVAPCIVVGVDHSTPTTLQGATSQKTLKNFISFISHVFVNEPLGKSIGDRFELRV